MTVALADLGMREIARNTGTELGGAPMDGDIGLQTERFLVYVNLFSDQRLARQAELGLRAKPDIRAAVGNGRTAIRTAGRIVFVANGRGGVVDEFRLDEVVRVVGRIAVPPPLRPAPADSRPAVATPDPDVLEQLRTLGELRTRRRADGRRVRGQESGAARSHLRRPSAGRVPPSCQNPARRERSLTRLAAGIGDRTGQAASGRVRVGRPFPGSGLTRVGWPTRPCEQPPD